MLRLLLVTCRLKDESETSFYLKTDATDNATLEEQACTVLPQVVPQYRDVSHIALFETAFLFMTACEDVSL
jgi:hypothetical protein